MARARRTPPLARRHACCPPGLCQPADRQAMRCTHWREGGGSKCAPMICVEPSTVLCKQRAPAGWDALGAGPSSAQGQRPGNGNGMRGAHPTLGRPAGTSGQKPRSSPRDASLTLVVSWVVTERAAPTPRERPWPGPSTVPARRAAYPHVTLAASPWLQQRSGCKCAARRAGPRREVLCLAAQGGTSRTALPALLAGMARPVGGGRCRWGAGPWLHQGAASPVALPRQNHALHARIRRATPCWG